jgi:O-antigen/teichoic acid export membrane protein
MIIIQDGVVEPRASPTKAPEGPPAPRPPPARPAVHAGTAGGAAPHCGKEPGKPAWEAWASLLLTQTGRMISTSSVLSLARISGALAGFVTQVVLARTLQANALGVFYSVTSLAAVVGMIASHGYPSIAPRFLSRYRQRGREDLIAAFLARARHSATIYVAIATLGVLILAVLGPSLSGEAHLALVAAALSIPAHAALRLNGAIAVAIRRFALAYLPTLA